jgi:hypothetical protein
MANPFFISEPYDISISNSGNGTHGIVTYSVDVKCLEGQTSNQQTFTIFYLLALTEAEFNQRLVDNALENAIAWCENYTEPEPPAEPEQ